MTNAPIAATTIPGEVISPSHSEGVASIVAATESAVLGAILWDSTFMDAASNLTVDVFHRSVHQDIFALMSELHESGQQLDALSFSQAVWQVKKISGKKVGDRQREELSHSLPHLITMSRYATTEDAFLQNVKQLRGYAAQRQIDLMGKQFGQLSSTADLDEIEQHVERAQEILSVGIAAQAKVEPRTMSDAITDRFEGVGNVTKKDHISTPFRGLNALLDPGLYRKNLVVIGARPSIGKSTIALDLARHASKVEGARVLFISLEMPEKDLSSRYLAAEAYVKLTKVKKMETESENITDAEWARLDKARNEMTERSDSLYLIDSEQAYVDGKFTVATLRRRLEGMRRRGKPVDMVVLDYIGLMDPVTPSENRQNDVAEISRSLKKMAASFDIPIIALSQLNRLVEQRADKRPMMSDLRESGAVEQDADVIILLHREDAYDRQSPRAGEIDLIVTKNRNGETGTVDASFQGHYARAIDFEAPRGS